MPQGKAPSKELWGHARGGGADVDTALEIRNAEVLEEGLESIQFFDVIQLQQR
jgi:hypothetical protein